MDFFPREIIPFLETFRNCFNASGFRYFLGFLWLSVGLQEKKCLTRLASCCPLFERHVSGWRRFFIESPWNLRLLRTKVYHFLITHLVGEVFYKGCAVAGVVRVLGCLSGAGCWVFKSGMITAAMLTVAASSWDITGDFAGFL